jgi:hypothetical protein
MVPEPSSSLVPFAIDLDEAELDGQEAALLALAAVLNGAVFAVPAAWSKGRRVTFGPDPSLNSDATDATLSAIAWGCSLGALAITTNWTTFAAALGAVVGLLVWFTWRQLVPGNANLRTTGSLRTLAGVWLIGLFAYLVLAAATGAPVYSVLVAMVFLAWLGIPVTRSTVRELRRCQPAGAAGAKV